MVRHFLLVHWVGWIGVPFNCLRRTYIIYRMMSEATTMVFADMLFVETLRLSGYSYDWSKRKIHPLLVETGVKPFEGSSLAPHPSGLELPNPHLWCACSSRWRDQWSSTAKQP